MQQKSIEESKRHGHYENLTATPGSKPLSLYRASNAGKQGRSEYSGYGASLVDIWTAVLNLPTIFDVLQQLGLTAVGLEIT